MPRGGKRPGSGAKEGNMNALKTGEHSRKVKELRDMCPEGTGFFMLTKKGGFRWIERKEGE